ncbi:alpha/beta hydrolase [Deinococcus cellulosilyticus]|nr:alpha/beta hydrolase-fold protein [Deinococcus cellulosilyticus]
MFTPEKVTLHIHLTLDRQAENVHLLSRLSQWKPDPAFRFEWTTGGYQLSLEVPRGLLLECRVSHGGFEEVGPDGLKRSPRVIAAGAEQTLQFEVLGFKQDLMPEETRSGHIEEHQIHSPELQDEVKLLIHLPSQYFMQPEARFPVVYLHDGHNLFDRATSSFGFDWQADETAERFAAEGHPVILVGIWTRQEKRMDYYIPFPSRFNGFRPQGLNYLDFIVQTLKPWVDGHFRVLQDRQHTAICGSSLGGIISLYGAFQHPEVFGTAGIMSPALWVGEYRALDETNQSRADVRYFVDMGDREGPTVESAANLVQLAKQLALQLSQQGSEVELLIGRDHLHHESAWAERLPAFLQFFLKI